jgi:single-stranded DNA-binding protein
MNNLNSILLEGKAIDQPSVIQNLFEMVVVSTRVHKTDDGYREEDTNISVTARGKFAESCHEQYQNGRGLRVIGRIAQSKDGKIYIEAEHIEWRPVITKATVKPSSKPETQGELKI